MNANPMEEKERPTRIRPLDESVMALTGVMPYTILNKFISLHNSLCDKEGYNGEFIYQSEILATQLAISRDTVSEWLQKLLNLKCKDGKERNFFIEYYRKPGELRNRFRLNTQIIDELNTTAKHYEHTYKYGIEPRTRGKGRPDNTQTIKGIMHDLLKDNTPFP